MSDGSTIETDWEQIARFVHDIDATNVISDIQRQFLQQRLESPEEHIVLITISVLDCVVINCSRAVRDQLATAKWMKVLLECFVKNLPKLSIRNAVQQLFSNWRSLLKHEPLGKEAKNVCKSMQSKNYVVPAPMEYPPQVKQLIETGIKPTEFQKGVDFLEVFYGATTGNRPAQPATVQMEPGRSSSTAETFSPRDSVPGYETTPDQPREEVSQSPATDTSVASVVRQMQADATSLLNATVQCEQAAQTYSVIGPSRSAMLEETMSTAMEAAAKCSSWTEQIQKMIEDGLDGEAIMEVLRINEGLNTALQQWKNTSEKLPKRSHFKPTSKSPAYSTPPSLSEPRSIDDAVQSSPPISAAPSARPAPLETGPPPRSTDLPLLIQIDEPPTRRETSPSPVTSPPISHQSSGNPFSRREGSVGHLASAAVSSPVDLSSVSLPLAAGPTAAAIPPPEPARQSGGLMGLEVEVQRLREDMLSLRHEHEAELRRCQDKALQEVQELRLQVTWLQQKMADKENIPAQQPVNVQELTNEIQGNKGMEERLAARVRSLEEVVSQQQKQITDLMAAIESMAMAGSSTRETAEYQLLAGRPSGPRGPPGRTISTASLQRTITRRSLASVDSFSVASGAGSFTSARGASFSAAPGGSRPSSFSEASPAELMQAYRKMPALRVRFTPQHFANVVTTVANEWVDEEGTGGQMEPENGVPAAAPGAS